MLESNQYRSKNFEAIDWIGTESDVNMIPIEAKTRSFRNKLKLK